MIEIWTFGAILRRAQKEHGKVPVISEKASLITNRMLVNMGVRGMYVEGSGEGEHHVIGNCRKGNPCEHAGKGVAELCPIFMWKAGLISDELG